MWYNYNVNTGIMGGVPVRHQIKVWYNELEQYIKEYYVPVRHQIKVWYNLGFNQYYPCDVPVRHQIKVWYNSLTLKSL